MTGRCPNHGVPLQPSNEPDIGICPISGYRFRVAVDDQDKEVRKDKFGKVTTNLKITPLDGAGG
jgi:hypothetical protein